jgi:hypothetical protein
MHNNTIFPTLFRVTAGISYSLNRLSDRADPTFFEFWSSHPAFAEQNASNAGT